MKRTIKFRAFAHNGKMLYAHCDNMATDLETWIDSSMEIMQFTGLLDKNGIEIFEGDILNGDGVVEWMQSSCEYVSTSNEGLMCLVHHLCSTYEVIGNIYLNPELLR